MKKIKSIISLLSAAAMTIPETVIAASAADKSSNSGIEQMIAAMTTEEKIE